MARRLVGPAVLMAARPKGFFDTWSVFCRQVLTLRIMDEDERSSLATVLLAASAVLGAASMLAIVKNNRALIDEQGERCGIRNLGTLASTGGATAGALAGGASGAWLARTLDRHSKPAEVDALQNSLSAARRTFETLRTDRDAGRITSAQHRNAVERLYVQMIRA